MSDLTCQDGVVTDAGDIVSLWVQKKLGGGLMSFPCVSIGLVHPSISDDKVDRDNLPAMLAAGVIFWNHQKGSGITGEDVSDIICSVATAGFEPAQFPQIAKILEYPFGRWGCRRISAEIEQGNDRAVRQAKALGFQPEGVKRRAGPGGRDILLYGLLPDECPFWTRRSVAA